MDWNSLLQKIYILPLCRSLYGFVDWNRKIQCHRADTESRSLYGFVDWNYSICLCINGFSRRSLYGFVDWNCSATSSQCASAVEAYTASWIEIYRVFSSVSLIPVEAYTASWIEIYPSHLWDRGLRSKPIRLRGLKWCTRSSLCSRVAKSKPIRLRGLKYINNAFIPHLFMVEAYTASWIEIQSA